MVRQSTYNKLLKDKKYYEDRYLMEITKMQTSYADTYYKSLAEDYRIKFENLTYENQKLAQRIADLTAVPAEPTIDERVAKLEKELKKLVKHPHLQNR